MNTSLTFLTTKKQVYLFFYTTATLKKKKKRFWLRLHVISFEDHFFHSELRVTSVRHVQRRRESPRLNMGSYPLALCNLEADSKSRCEKFV